jgi:hypothetical protein
MSAWTRITEVYGSVNGGESRAIWVGAENGIEYLAKGPSLTPGWRHVGANELIAAQLAQRLGLPVLECRLLRMEQDLFVGTTWMSEAQFHPFITEALLEKCSNKDRIYPLVVFDSWICNTDRHEGNLLVRCSGLSESKGKSCSALRHTLLISDHNRSLLPDNLEVDHFDSLLKRKFLDEFILIGYIRNRIVNLQRLQDAVGLAEGVTDTDIDSIVNAVPDQLLADADKPAWTSFLTDRRDQLRTLLNENRSLFQYLARGDL